MPPKLKQFLQRWVISTVAVLVATYIVKGIHYERWQDLLIATLVLGVLNTLLRPILMVLSLPLVIFTLGLFTIVINAILLLVVDLLLRPKFTVDGFWSAFWAALVISIVSLVLNSVTGSGESRVSFSRGKKQPRRRDKDDDGPVIDV